MNIENISKTLLSSITKNGKVLVPVSLAGVATLAVFDLVKELRK